LFVEKKDEDWKRKRLVGVLDDLIGANMMGDKVLMLELMASLVVKKIMCMAVVLLMEEILHQLIGNPIIYRCSYIPSAGFQPSTVWMSAILPKSECIPQAKESPEVLCKTTKRFLSKRRPIRSLALSIMGWCLKEDIFKHIVGMGFKVGHV